MRSTSNEGTFRENEGCLPREEPNNPESKLSHSRVYHDRESSMATDHQHILDRSSQRITTTLTLSDIVQHRNQQSELLISLEYIE